MIKRIVFIVLLAILALVGTAVWIYADIANEVEASDRVAVQQAQGVTDLTHVDRVDYFAGENVWYIVRGTNDQAEPMIVWVGPVFIHMEMANDGLSERDVREQVIARHGEVEIVRIIPGVWRDQYVWEAFFYKNDEDGKRPYYEYIRFRDGSVVESLRLNAE